MYVLLLGSNLPNSSICGTYKKIRISAIIKHSLEIYDDISTMKCF